jgi:hypothetical protein
VHARPGQHDRPAPPRRGRSPPRRAAKASTRRLPALVQPLRAHGVPRPHPHAPRTLPLHARDHRSSCIYRAPTGAAVHRRLAAASRAGHC